MSDLKFAIANALIVDLQRVEANLLRTHQALERLLTPGNVVITLNWDLVIERYAWLHGIPIREDGSPSDDAVLLLKLHGSVDWSLRESCKRPVALDDYAVIRERFGADRSYTIPFRDADTIVRTRALENWNGAWRRIKSRTSSPFIVTMSQGKGNDLVKIEPVWRAAYDALSASSRIEVIGYSMPHDDVEVRALLRAGIKRGPRDPRVVVQNPSNDVHDRVRNFLFRDIRSIYVPFPGF